jgi:hypothetical protein
MAPIMRRPFLLAVVTTIALAAPVATAGALEVGVSGGVLTVAPGAGESSLSPTVDYVAGPCSWPIRAGDDLNSAKSTFDDAAGCLLTDLPDRDPGPGCAVSDSLGAAGEVAGHEVAARLTVCGLSGVERVQVRGGSGDDRITFDPRYAFGGTTVVTTGEGPDEVVAADGAVEQIDCGGGFDTATEDPGDTSRNCEEGNGTTAGAQGAHDGRIERRGGALVADFSTARGNELHRVVAGVSVADAGAISVSSLAAGPPALGEGCSIRQRDGDALCSGTGLGSIEVLGPRGLKDAFVLRMGLGGGGDHPFTGPVAIHAGPGESYLETDDGVAERVDCGLYWDQVIADAHDTVEGSCERSQGEGTLLPQNPGTIAARAKTKSGRLPFYHGGNSGQGVLLRISCPAVVKDGCGGVAEVGRDARLRRAPHPDDGPGDGALRRSGARCG